uniref:PorP/SprF family type IX secretion system membrane protein n=1 Tax=Fulvivirga sp. TaxID=1931237 RepID=UPI00404954AE
MKKIYQVFQIVAVVLGARTMQAQQQVMFTQYMFNQLAINPAYAGIHEGISTSMLFREQWVGFKGAPSTQTISIHSPLNHREASLGALIMRDRIGITERFSANFSYAYRIDFGKSKLSFGLQGSLNQFMVRYNEDALIDPTINNRDVNVLRPNVGSGLMWHSDKFYLGASVPQLITQKFNPGNPDVEGQLVRHYFLLAGYVFDINKDLKLKPNILLKHVDGAPTQIDLNANLLIKELVWLGVSYRSLDSFDFLVQFQLSPKWQIGYSFDFLTTTDISLVQSGSHEFMLNYIFELPRTKILTPRYF